MGPVEAWAMGVRPVCCRLYLDLDIACRPIESSFGREKNVTSSDNNFSSDDV